MFPTLGHLINYLFGTNIHFPMPTYGFILVMAFATGGLVLNIALKRKEKLGLLKTHPSKVLVSSPINYFDILISSIFYFVVAFKIVGIIVDYQIFEKNVNDYIFSKQGSPIAGFIFAIIGFSYLLYKAKKIESKEPVYKEVAIWPHQITMNIVMVAALSGIIGAKFFDILENLGSFFKDPMAQIFSSGGFTFYGGLIVGSISVYYYTKRLKINTLHLLDSAAPAILAAYAVGRMACMLSGDGCWGIPNPEPKPEWLAFIPNWMWGYDFPHNVINEGVKISGCNDDFCYILETPVFPTPFYESALSLIFFLFVWFIQNKIKVPATMFFIALLLNGTARFFVEQIRVNNVYHIGNAAFTQAQIISSFLILLGITGIIVLKKLYKKGKI